MYAFLGRKPYAAPGATAEKGGCGPVHGGSLRVRLPRYATCAVFISRSKRLMVTGKRKFVPFSLVTPRGIARIDSSHQAAQPAMRLRGVMR